MRHELPEKPLEKPMRSLPLLASFGHLGRRYDLGVGDRVGEGAGAEKAGGAAPTPSFSARASVKFALMGIAVLSLGCSESH